MIDRLSPTETLHAAAPTLPTDDTPVADAAVLYALAGLPPIPLYGLAADGACSCGHPDCHPRNRGKHPMGTAWQKRATLDVDDVRDRFRGHHGNVGVYLALTGLVLVDADGDEGLATAASWSLPETLSAQSGSGKGAHFIYRLAPHQDAAAITDRSRIAPGLDVKVRGQFVAAPSRHASGGVYRWTRVRAPALLPDWLFDRLRKSPPTPPPPHSGPTLSRWPQSAQHLEKRARGYMAKVPPAIAGAKGHDQMFAAARVLAGFVLKTGLPESVALALLGEYNATCKPPWSNRELDHKWSEAKKARVLPALEDRPMPARSAPARPRLRLVGAASPAGGGAAAEAAPDAQAAADGVPVGDDDGQDHGGDRGGPPSGGDGPPAPPPAPDWRASLRYVTSRTGVEKLVTDTDNLTRILQLDPRWAGKIRFDDFRHRIWIADDVPWDDFNRPSAYVGTWTDEDATRMAGWMRREWHSRRFEPSTIDCERAVAAVARTRDFNPVREYLTGLEWDGESRLGRWLRTYLGTEDTEYMRLVGGWWLISAVARIFDPGCKVDTVPILEGPQGTRKSTALRVLCGAEWFNDTPIDIDSKDAYTAIQGCWIVELAELESLVKARSSRVKAFLSSGKDRFRRAYARHERDEKRQCIFVGTVNLNEYLTDPTGARRFWPIACGRIDVDALARDRDQLWAEAVAEYEGGRPWYPLADAEQQLVRGPQEERTEVDAWEQCLADWLSRAPSEVLMSDVLTGALNLERKDWTKPVQTRVGVAMTSRLGWQKRRVTRGDKQVWVYERRASTTDRQNSEVV